LEPSVSSNNFTPPSSLDLAELDAGRYINASLRLTSTP
jgi:hypothetical protein